MKVKHLIDQLSKQDPEANVNIPDVELNIFIETTSTIQDKTIYSIGVVAIVLFCVASIVAFILCATNWNNIK